MKNVPEAASSGTPYSVRAVQRVLDILDLLEESPEGISLGDVALAARLPKSSAFRYLATLEGRRYVDRDPASGNYRLGLGLLALHTRHLQTVTARARPYLEELRERFHETINLGTLDGNRVVYLEILESPRAMRLAARRGDRDPVHSTALGKALAAQRPSHEVERILAAEGMAKLTPRTITDRGEFLKVLESVRRTGFAVDNSENEEGGRCVAVAIPLERMPLAISLSAPAVRFSMREVEAVAAELTRAARRFADEVGETAA
jgi:IclR family transcriptional regulator, acetate operon repressor